MTQSVEPDEKQVEQVMHVLLSQMSQETRTPLNSIIGFSDVMAKGICGPVNEEQKKILRTIHKNSRYLSNAFDEILNVTRLVYGRLNLYFEEIDLSQIIEQAISDTWQHWTLLHDPVEPSILDTSIPNAIPDIWADSLRVQQAIMGILVECISEIRYNRDERKVLLTLSYDDTWMSFDFSIKGQVSEYFPNENSPRLFYSQSIIKAHSGQIRLRQQEDRHQGIIFTLPISNHKPSSD